MPRSPLIALLAATFIAGAAQAQEIRGIVRDSASGVPVPGAVVAGLDAAGATLIRALSSDQGRYRIVQAAGIQRLRITRIGFRPRDIAVPTNAAAVSEIDVLLPLIPTLLQPVNVAANAGSCPARPDAVAAAGLFDQARAGLLSTVVARETSPATVTRLAYERVLDANGEGVVSQRVRMENADRATVSFSAVRTSVDFARNGFADDTGGRRTYFGPDADVLLDDAFAAAYCFRVDPAPASRVNQVGLGFTPARRQDGRVDIDGTLWIDTVRRTLSDVEFRYLGAGEIAEGFRTGGTIAFREVTPGITLIDRWSLRLVGAVESTLGDPSNPGNTTLSRRYAVREIGGELARASWPDGRSWTAPLGAVRLTAQTAAGTPAAGVDVRLADTDYRGTSDATGTVTIPLLVPGPYAAILAEPRLDAIGIQIPTGLNFVAVRDSVVPGQFTAATAEEFVAGSCRASGRVDDGSAWIFARVGTTDGRAVGGAKWQLAKGGAGGWSQVSQGGSTGATGLFTYCRGLKVGETVQIQAWQGKDPRAVSTRKLTEKVTITDVRLPTGAAGRVAGGAVVQVTGSVTDSVTGAPATEAIVTLIGVPGLGITDSTGRFTIPDVPRGEYTAEIRSPALDEIGVVGRSTVSIAPTSASMRLHLPTRAQLVAAMCGVDPADAVRASGVGVLIGRVRSPAADATTPARLVAEWADGAVTTGRTKWLRVRADETGTFRLCGVPVQTSLVLRTQVDSGAGMAARPLETRLEGDQAFARVDVSLEAGLSVGGAFAGYVIADSTDLPIADAEVTFPDLKRSVLTNAEGAFRVNDIPPGKHRVTVRRPGFGPLTASIDFAENQTIEHTVVLGQARTGLAAVEITGTTGPSSFEENRKMGLGKFVTRDILEQYAGRDLTAALSSQPSLGRVAERSTSYGWIVGRRTPPKLRPQIFAPMTSADTMKWHCSKGTGQRTGYDLKQPYLTSGAGPGACEVGADDLRMQGIYCPQAGEDRRGITCACYAQVYVDGKLMNSQRPTEPFDVNAMKPEDVEGVEWYSSPAQTPAQYSSLNSSCGVMVIWTRRGGRQH